MGIVESLLTPPPRNEASVAQYVIEDALSHGWTLQENNDRLELLPPSGTVTGTTWCIVQYGADKVCMPECVYDENTRRSCTRPVTQE